ncbi:hypothetical protein CVIRNUC_008892 [Coccomyxa viridis]|uniref:FAD-binding domain-containing protein n=1 Tax=Coccomyxa viridis TaxID=1274662 RepID=A0AAV1IFU2_9CHLO|nr:hypothetical protein CVIRNUC_008892 [Coccomyxa viridis]
MPQAASGFPIREVVIVGGGYGALAAALALHKVGIPTLVLERAPTTRQEGFAWVALNNAWRAFEALGVADDIRKDHMPQTRINYADSHQVVYRSLDVQTVGPRKGLQRNEIRVIRRLAAPTAMADLLPEGTVHYGCKVVDVTTTPSGAEVELDGGQKLQAKLVIAGDGVHSRSAAKYHKATLRKAPVGSWRSLVELDCEQQGKPESTFYSGPNIRAGTFPCAFDATRKKMLWFFFVATVMSDQEMAGYDSHEKHVKGIRKHTRGWEAPHLEKCVSAAVPGGIQLSRIYERPVKAGEPWFEGCLTGVGDCAHATRPDLMQGGAMAVEDGVELGVFFREAMEEAGKPFGELTPAQIAAVLRKYETARSHRVAQIIAASTKTGNMFRRAGFLPRWLMRLVLAWLYQPFAFLDHTLWAPHGQLCPPLIGKHKDLASA